MVLIWWRRGATTYELQVWRLVIRWVHLSGEYWRLRPWRRFSVRYYPDEDQE